MTSSISLGSLGFDGWRDVALALTSVQQSKGERHARTCRSHGFHFIPFGFSSLGSLRLAAEELLSRICQRYNSHARVSYTFLGLIPSILRDYEG